MSKIFHLNCKNCKNDFISKGSSTRYCNNCIKQVKCSDCGINLNFTVLKTDTKDYYCKKHSYKHRKFTIQCERCKKEFKSSGNKTKYCDDCKKELEFINTHTCSMCNIFREDLTRDQNGRGYECGCHDKWNKEHWGKINSSEEMNEIRKQNAEILLNSDGFKEHITQHNQDLRNFNIETDNCNIDCKYFDECEFKTKRKKNYLNYCSEYFNFLGSFSNGMFDFDQNIECNNNCTLFNQCKNKDLLLKNIYGYCQISLSHGKHIFYQNCNKCNFETPHKYDCKIGEFYCQVCAGEKVWCEKCEQFETIDFNSQKDHNIFYKSATKKWINENFDLVEFLEEYIIGFKNLIDSNRNICGIYEWLINGHSWYIGQSTDILSRSYDHMKSFYESPEYFDFQQRTDIEDIINDENYSIEVRVLEECDEENLDKRELYWIDQHKPFAQKCDGTDNIKSLEERKFNKL